MIRKYPASRGTEKYRELGCPEEVRGGREARGGEVKARRSPGEATGD